MKWFVLAIFPESVWAKGSSKSGGLLYTFICSHLHTFSSSHLHTFTSSHLHHLLIFKSSHFHIFTSSHLLIFTSSLSLSLCVSCPVTVRLLFCCFFSFKAAGSADDAPLKWPPFGTKWGSSVKNWKCSAIKHPRRQPSRLCVKASVCKTVCVQASVYKSFCVEALLQSVCV